MKIDSRANLYPQDSSPLPAGQRPLQPFNCCLPLVRATFLLGPGQVLWYCFYRQPRTPDAHPLLPRLRDRPAAGTACSCLYRESRGPRASSPRASRSCHCFAVRPRCRPRQSHRPCQPRRSALPRYSRDCRSCPRDHRSSLASRYRDRATPAQPRQPSFCHPPPRSRRCARYEIGDHPRIYSAPSPCPFRPAAARLSRNPDAPE
jgi:hypothetical protein